MTWIKEMFVRFAARGEADLGIHSVEDHLTQHLGPRRQFDAVTNHEHAHVARNLGRKQEAAEWQDDLRKAEAESSHHQNAKALLFGIVCSFAFESFGSSLVMKAIGVGERERLPLALALALAVIALTAVTSNRTAGPTKPTAGAATPRRWQGTALILGAYTALLVALAAIRLRSSGEEESGLEALPEAITMLATSVGPAWIAEYLIRKRRPAVLVADQIKRLRRYIRSAQQDERAANQYMARLSREQAAWDRDAARLRAIYEAKHRFQTAKAETAGNKDKEATDTTGITDTKKYDTAKSRTIPKNGNNNINRRIRP